MCRFYFISLNSEPKGKKEKKKVSYFMTTLIMLSNTGLQYLVQGIQVITTTISESRLTDSAVGMF